MREPQVAPTEWSGDSEAKVDHVPNTPAPSTFHLTQTDPGKRVTDHLMMKYVEFCVQMRDNL